ncbi:glycosyltransferase family 2 protein [Rhodococcus sp. NPDC003318]|uniref:glycosyltransferase family 2 protein n=1 Tax=Rhodococcus sp. NPDC003318 TaxID=3364503 RepID=UPI00368D6AC2
MAAGDVTPLQSATTVVVATRNRAVELQRTLRELRSLRPPPAVVVVDNASTDDTAGVVQAVNATGAGHRPVDWIRLERNCGVAARNVGVEQAVTRYVAFCDDDSWYHPHALRLAEQHLDDHPRLGLVAARVVVLPAGRTDPVCEEMARSPLGRERTLPGPSVLGFLACGAIVRRTAFLEAGGFNDVLHFPGEEEMLALDLATLGWALCYVPEVVAYHQPSAGAMPGPARRRREERNRILTALMRRPGSHCRRLLTALAGDTVRDPRKLTLWVSLARHAPAALGRRAPVSDGLESRVELLELLAARRATGVPPTSATRWW